MRFGPIIFCVGLGLSCIVAARADSPRITLKIEQPAYAGLPIWLDVESDDPCLAVHYTGNMGGFAEGGHAEVIGSDGQELRVGFQAHFYRHGSVLQEPGACPSDYVSGHGGTHRIPLHLVANLREPGQYSVRWLVPKTTKLGAVPPTDWLKFEVLPSTQDQREAWLADLLAHQPDDWRALRENYIPSLLAESDDPKVRHKLLEISCSADYSMSTSVLQAFHAALSDDEQIYLAQLIVKGCPSGGLDIFVGKRAPMEFPEAITDQQRERLFEATTAAIPRAKGADLAHAITRLTQLKESRNDDDPASVAADAAVLQALPRILGGPDDQRAGSDDDPKRSAIYYFEGSYHDPDGREVVKRFAEQDDQGAVTAFIELLNHPNAADLPFLKDRLMGPQGATFVNNDLNPCYFVAHNFGAAGMELVQSLLNAKTAPVRGATAVYLALQGDRTAMATVIDRLRSGSVADRVELMNRLVGTPACPLQGDACHRYSDATIDLNTPWVIEGEEELIKYFTAALEKKS